MGIFNNLIFWASVSWIIISLLLFNVGNRIPFDFANETLEDQFYLIAWVSFPVSVLLTLLRTTKNSFGNRKALIIALTIVVAMVSLALLTWEVFGNSLCGHNTQVVFKKEGDPYTEIIAKRKDCGATTSESEPEFFINKSLIWPLVYSEKVDTTELNHSEWDFLPSEENNYR